MTAGAYLPVGTASLATAMLGLQLAAIARGKRDYLASCCSGVGHLRHCCHSTAGMPDGLGGGVVGVLEFGPARNAAAFQLSEPARGFSVLATGGG